MKKTYASLWGSSPMSRLYDALRTISGTSEISHGIVMLHLTTIESLSPAYFALGMDK